MNITVEISGTENLRRDAALLAARMNSPVRAVARQLGEVTLSAVRSQYASAGRRGPKGRPWTRKQSTIDRYTAMNRRGFAVINEPMRRTDALFKSESTFGAPHAIFEVTDDAVVMGTDLVYGSVWQARGQTQYDPTLEDVARYASIIKRGIVKDANTFFDFVDEEFAF